MQKINNSKDPNEHEDVAKDRRKLLLALINNTLLFSHFKTIIYIGGSFKREPPMRGIKTIYINPIKTASDQVNNAAILSYIAS